MKKLSKYVMIALRSLPAIPKFKVVAKIFVLLVVCTSLISITPQKASAQTSVSFQVFYDDLSPFGEWVQNPDYGYVWIPNVSEGFAPYSSNGYWILTEAGWTWVSNYEWGWAPFHYGRWFYDSYYGWVWVPGNQWGPGWVTWRRSDDYYGWTPIGPDVSLDMAYGNNYTVPSDRWRFVRDRDFGRTDINKYYVSTASYTEIINNSTTINNIQVDNSRNERYNAGPDKADVEKRAGKTFSPVVIKESSAPTQSLKNNQLEIFRPQVQKSASVAQKPAPSKVVAWKGNESTKKQQVQPQNNQQATQQQQSKQQAQKQNETQQQEQLKKQQQQQQSEQQLKKQQQQQQSEQQAQKQQETQQQEQLKKQQQQQQSEQQAQKQNDQQAKKQQHQGTDQAKNHQQPTKKQVVNQKAPQAQKDSTKKD